MVDLARHHVANLRRLRAVGSRPLQDLEAVADRRKGVAQFVGERGQELVLAPIRLAQGLHKP